MRTTNTEPTRCPCSSAIQPLIDSLRPGEEKEPDVMLMRLTVAKACKAYADEHYTDCTNADTINGTVKSIAGNVNSIAGSGRSTELTWLVVAPAGSTVTP